MTDKEVYYMYVVPSLVECFPLKKGDIKPSSRFKQDLKLDSMDMLDLLCNIEDKFGKELISTDEEKAKFQKTFTGTVWDLTIVLTECITTRENLFHEKSTN